MNYKYFKILKKIIKTILILLVFNFVLIINSCNNIVDNLLKESSNLKIKVEWDVKKTRRENISRSIPDDTDHIIISLKSKELENYKKTIQIEKDDNEEKVITLFPGNYDLLIIAVKEELISNKKYYKILNYYVYSFEIAPNKTKYINANLKEFGINHDISDISNFKIGDTFFFYITSEYLKDFLEIYSFYYILDFNENGDNNTSNIKNVRVTKSFIEKNILVNKTTFVITCNTKIDDFLNTKAKLGYKIELRLNKKLFENNFYDENNIYKIYFFKEVKNICIIEDHSNNGTLQLNIN